MRHILPACFRVCVSFVYRRSVSNPLEINYSHKICRHGYIMIIMMSEKLYSHVDVFVVDSNQTKYNIL